MSLYWNPSIAPSYFVWKHTSTMCLMVWTCARSQSGVSNIFHLCKRKLHFSYSVLIPFREVHIVRGGSNHGILWLGSLTTFPRFQIFCHTSSSLSVVLSIDKIGCLDLNPLFDVLLMPLKTRRFVDFWYCCNNFTVTANLRVFGGAIFDSTRNHCILVNRTRSNIIRIVLFYSTPTFLV